MQERILGRSTISKPTTGERVAFRTAKLISKDPQLHGHLTKLTGMTVHCGPDSTTSTSHPCVFLWRNSAFRRCRFPRSCTQPSISIDNSRSRFSDWAARSINHATAGMEVDPSGLWKRYSIRKCLYLQHPVYDGLVDAVRG